MLLDLKAITLHTFVLNTYTILLHVNAIQALGVSCGAFSASVLLFHQLP